MRIVTDAVADLPPWLSERVEVVPLRVIVRGRTYSSAELSPAEIHRLLQELRPGEMNTSQPSPKEFMDVFRRIGEPAVYVAASSLLSGTINSARIALRVLGRKDIFIVDSLSASVGQGLLTYYALRLAEEGVDAEEIAARIEEKRAEVRVHLTVGSLEYLRASGRIGNVAAFFGKVLDVVPILSLRGGRVHLDRVVRRKDAVRELAKLLDAEYVWLGSVCAPDGVRELARELRGTHEEVPGGPVISVHVGPGSFGGAFIRGFNPSR